MMISVICTLKTQKTQDKEKNKMGVMGVYSILYYMPDEEGYTTYAVDWGFMVRGQWARSYKEYCSTRWHLQEGLVDSYSYALSSAQSQSIESGITVKDEAYQALLKHFGLERWEGEFPPEKIITMSPAKLVAERRKKEELHSLKRKEMFNNTIGDYSPAEKFE